jgi:hypothetical protein
VRRAQEGAIRWLLDADDVRLHTDAAEHNALHEALYPVRCSATLLRASKLSLDT